MAIWVISELYYPEESATGHYMTNIAEHLAKFFPVNVLSVQPSYSAKGIHVPTYEIRNGVNICRVFSTKFDKDKILLRLLNIFTISFSIFINLLKKLKKQDVVFVVTNPPTLPYVAAIACKIKKTKLILRVDDVYPDVLSAAGLIRKNSYVYKFFNLLSKWLYCSSDRIVVLGDDMMQLIKDKLSNKKIIDKVVTITNWSDNKDVKPEAKINNILLKELKLTEKFIVQCAGNIGKAQDIECLFEAAKILKNVDDIHFLFVGGGAKKNWLEKSVHDNGLKNITVIPNRPRKDQNVFLNACDIALLSLIPGMWGVSVPSRFYNILAAGKPVIGVVDKYSEIGNVITKENIGWVSPPGQPAQLADTIIDAYNSQNTLIQIGKKARVLADNKFSEQIIKDYYFKLFNKLI